MSCSNNLSHALYSIEQAPSKAKVTLFPYRIGFSRLRYFICRRTMFEQDRAVFYRTRKYLIHCRFFAVFRCTAVYEDSFVRKLLHRTSQKLTSTLLKSNLQPCRELHSVFVPFSGLRVRFLTRAPRAYTSFGERIRRGT